jgi:hypothetical protein
MYLTSTTIAEQLKKVYGKQIKDLFAESSAIGTVYTGLPPLRNSNLPDDVKERNLADVKSITPGDIERILRVAFSAGDHPFAVVDIKCLSRVDLDVLSIEILTDDGNVQQPFTMELTRTDLHREGLLHALQTFVRQAAGWWDNRLKTIDRLLGKNGVQESSVGQFDEEFENPPYPMDSGPAVPNKSSGGSVQPPYIFVKAAKT